MSKITCEDIFKAGSQVKQLDRTARMAEEEWSKALVQRDGRRADGLVRQACLTRAVAKKAAKLAGMAWRALQAHRHKRAAEYLARFWAFVEQMA